MIATVVTVLAAGVAWLVTRVCVDELARRAAVQAANHRGLAVAATGGVALGVGLVCAAAIAAVGLAWVPSMDDPPSLRQLLVLHGIGSVIPVVLGFALIGLYDDVAGSSKERGWAVHMRAVREARATPGAIKVVAGTAIALAAAGGTGILDLLTAAAIVALSANLLNAADARPLRALKFAAVWLVALMVAAAITSSPPAIGAVVVMAACLAALWRPEAQERIMLGDTGANALGAALGFLTVATERASGHADVSLARWLLLGGVLLLTFVSARPGFSAVIAKVGPLRSFDLWGRQPDPPRDDMPQ